MRNDRSKPAVSARSPVPLALLLAAWFAGPACAQTTWTVNQAGGQGAQFTSLAPAIAAAADGDVILVRPGLYIEAQLDIDKGLTILGEPGVVVQASVFGMPGMVVRDLPPTSAFAMRGLQFGSQLASTPVRISNCDGLVLLEGLEGPIGGFGLPENFGVEIEGSDQVHLHDLLIRGGQMLRIESSVATITDCTLAGGISGVVELDGADVTIDRSAISIEPIVSFAPAMQVNGGRTTLARSTVLAPTSQQTPQPAIATQGIAELRVDPTTVLTPTAGEPAISGPATVSNDEVDTLARSSQGVVDFDLHSRTGSLFVAYATLPSPTTPLPFGVLWLDIDPALQLTVSAGIVQNRQLALSLDTTPLPVGLPFTVQTAILDPTFTLSLTNGVAVLAN